MDWPALLDSTPSLAAGACALLVGLGLLAGGPGRPAHLALAAFLLVLGLHVLSLWGWALVEHPSWRYTLLVASSASYGSALLLHLLHAASVLDAPLLAPLRPAWARGVLLGLALALLVMPFLLHGELVAGFRVRSDGSLTAFRQGILERTVYPFLAPVLLLLTLGAAADGLLQAEGATARRRARSHLVAFLLLDAALAAGVLTVGLPGGAHPAPLVATLFGPLVLLAGVLANAKALPRKPSSPPPALTL